MPLSADERNELGNRFLESLPYPPYPVQEEAILAWFMSEQGVLVCAPTGTGKTLIAHAALYEALHSNTVAYYTTPLIALTEQKFQEMQKTVQQWGFPPEVVGLVTGHRRVNPSARILIVVAEILLNRLLNPKEFEFEGVSAVVMDEFHSFADPERGIVWELSLSLLPPHVRLMLLSATVGNAQEFINWLDNSHQRKLDLVESRERKVPLSYHWINDQLLNEQLVLMAEGPPETRKTPALVFCFNRDQCWSVAEQLKGLPLLGSEQKAPLHERVNQLDWTQGVGPKMKQMLHRGVGVHHAGLLPKYRRVIEELFERKLLAVAVCTETLAAGINLPARSVVLTSLVKGPFGKEKLIDPSTAQQIFGRAGRPQYDREGYVYALAHEDDVKILRWREKYEAIPEDTRDPALIKQKKDLKRKKPERRSNAVYWTDTMFEKLRTAPPGRLYSKGQIPWRLLAHLLKKQPEVSIVRKTIRKRFLDTARIIAGEKHLDRMLLTLAKAGYVTLSPQPPDPKSEDYASAIKEYSADAAEPTPKLDTLLVFRSVHPLYGAFLVEQLGIANRDERLQALESVLEMPRPLLKFLRVPDDVPAGPLATERLDAELITRGLMLAPKPPEEDEEEDDDPYWKKDEPRPPSLAEKLRLKWDADFPEVGDFTTSTVWAAGELLRYNGNFNLYVKSKDLIKQEGIIFRHLLRLILLCGEFLQLTPPEGDAEQWKAELREIAGRLTDSCREVDPQSTDQAVQAAKVVAETPPSEEAPPEVVAETPVTEEFGAGIWD